MSIISGPFLCFECSNPKEIIINVHRLYDNKEDAQKRIKKIKKTTGKRLELRKNFAVA